MSTPTATDYDIRAYRDADEPAVLDLLQRSLAGGPTGQRTAAFFRWKHEHNPFGRSLALVATQNGAVVGFRTFMRWRFRTTSGPIEAVRAVDTATHPDHQGRGIFTRLTQAALEQARASAALVFNTPNDQSRPGYLKLGWNLVGTLPIQLRPARPVRFATRATSRARGTVVRRPAPGCAWPPAAEVLEDAAAVEELLAQAGAPAEALATDRSAAYLRWRYADAPELDYRAIRIDDAHGLAGLAIGRPRWRGGLAEFSLAEIITRPGDGRSARRLLRAAARAGCDHVATHLGLHRGLRRAGWVSGYLSVPRVGMVLTTHPLRTLSPDPRALSSWRLSLGDLEVF